MPAYVNVDSVAKSKTIQEAVKSAMLDMAIQVLNEDSGDSPTTAVYDKRIALANDCINYPDKHMYEATRLICYNQPTIELDGQATFRYLVSENPSSRNVFSNASLLNNSFQETVSVGNQIRDKLAGVNFNDINV